MNVWLKKKWLKNLVFVGVCAVLSSYSVFPQTSQPQETNKENSSVNLVSATLSKSNEDSFLSSTELLLLVTTPEEIKLREQQVQLLQEWERLSKLRFQAGVGTQEEVSEAVYSSYHKKIELLQAKNLLQLKEQKSTLSRLQLVITPEEIQLREQQLQAVKQTVKDIELRERAGLGLKSDVIRANIFRFDSEIELLQAKQLLKLKQQGELSAVNKEVNKFL